MAAVPAGRRIDPRGACGPRQTTNSGLQELTMVRATKSKPTSRAISGFSCVGVRYTHTHTHTHTLSLSLRGSVTPASDPYMVSRWSNCW